jgi:adenine-specific DNA methylase
MEGKEIKRDKYGRPKVFLEQQCPIEELSIESQRERGASSALPPLYFLHVWWARRPLTVSRAAILGSLLPADFDRKEFLGLMGIEGNPISDKKRINEANKTGTKLSTGFTYKRGFSNTIPIGLMNKMRSEVETIWGTSTPTVLDAFAGGGSIPFESVRMGFNTIANELNPVATVIQKATIEYPLKYGEPLAKDIERIGEEIAVQLEDDLSEFFPKKQGEEIFAYIWVRTVQCPKCGLHIPLAPNWWLNTAEDLGYQLQLPDKMEDGHCSFKIVKASSSFDPEVGTIKRGIATCPNPACNNVIEGGTIKEEAQAGRMGHQLAAIGYKMKGRSGRHFREVTQMDLDGVVKAEEMLKKRFPEWEAKGLVPTENIPEGNKTREPRNVGIMKWYQMFNPRQLLVHLTTLETIISSTKIQELDDEKREAIRTYLQISFDKCVDYNALLNTWESTRVIVKHVFQRHDYAFTWSYGEIDGAGNLFRFGYSQISDAYAGICKLINGSKSNIQILNGDASSLTSITDGSVDLIATDPPYYDNVMYSECSDFFYVWMKRGLGDIFPELFSSELTDKDLEAVANVSRFKGSSTSASKLAARDYEAKMLAAFREMHRVLKDDGVLNIMFTHKKVEAWDTLSHALLEAGFIITASWPIHTESEHSLHQAKKNAAASTILLVCRKRPAEAETSWWEDLQPSLDEVVRTRAEEFASSGLRGQDISIACFGPALQVISESWPVKKRDGSVIRPDEALDRARYVVSQWFMERIAEGKAEALDPATRYYILAWFLFNAREFPFDEGRKLGLSLNVEVEDLIRKKILNKKGNYIKFLKPKERMNAKGLDPSAKMYENVIDYVQAAMCAYEAGQTPELTRFHVRTGALAKQGYREAIEYLLDVLPKTKEVVEYDILNKMWESNYRDSIKRKVRNTDPTGEKQSRLPLELNDEDTEEEDEEVEEEE